MQSPPEPTGTDAILIMEDFFRKAIKAVEPKFLELCEVIDSQFCDVNLEIRKLQDRIKHLEDDVVELKFDAAIEKSKGKNDQVEDFARNA